MKKDNKDILEEIRNLKKNTSFSKSEKKKQ